MCPALPDVFGLGTCRPDAAPGALKGSVGAYGFAYLTHLCRQLEQGAKDGNLGDLKRLAPDLVSYLDRVEIVPRALNNVRPKMVDFAMRMH